MINRTKVKESTQIKPGDNGDVLVMKDNAPEWSTPSDADLAKASETDTKLAEKQDKLVAGDNIHIVGNTISADGKPTPIAIGTVTSGEVPMVSNSGTDTDVVLNFVLPKGDKGDPGNDGTQVNNLLPLTVDTPPAYGDMATSGIAVGNGAKVNARDAVVIGDYASAELPNWASYSEGVAIGNYSKLYSPSSVAIGMHAEAGPSPTSGSVPSAVANIAIGNNANAHGSRCVNIGGIMSPRLSDAVSIGGGNTKANSSIAIGTRSIASQEKTVAFGNGTSFNRRIIGVADPTGAQDAATKNYVDTKISEIPTGTEVNNIAPLQVSNPPAQFNGQTNTAIGYGAVCHEGVAIGAHSTSQGNREAVAVGHYATAVSGVAIGGHTEVSAPSSVAIGGYSSTAESNVVSVGSGDATMALTDDMDEETKARIQSRAAAATRRIVNVTDPRDAQDAATKNYVDTQLTPINAKLQYVPENTNQILSQIQTNVEKAQAAAEAAQTTADGTEASLTTLQNTVNQQAETIAQLQQTITQLQSTIANLTLETERI